MHGLFLLKAREDPTKIGSIVCSRVDVAFQRIAAGRGGIDDASSLSLKIVASNFCILRARGSGLGSDRLGFRFRLV